MNGPVDGRTPRQAATPVRLRVPFGASSVPGVRRDLRDWLLDRGSPQESVDEARMVVTELIANAVRHARPLPDGSLVVCWQLTGDGLRISVTDGGSPTRPHTVDAPVSATSGRGMSIVDTLVTDWWLENTPSRTTVHTMLAVGLPLG